MRTITRVVLAAAASLGASVLPGVAQAKVHITVDLDNQTIHVEAKDQVFDWKVSSGKPGYETPAGRFGVLWMDRDHHSDEYEGAYMPDAIFFAPGYAIHGFGKSPWGRKASHGCVRLPVAKAEILFDLVKAQGAEVNIVGYSPTVLAATPSKRPEASDEAMVGSAQGDARAYRAEDGSAPDRFQDDRARGYDAPAYSDSMIGGPRQQRGRSSDDLFGSVY